MAQPTEEDATFRTEAFVERFRCRRVQCLAWFRQSLAGSPAAMSQRFQIFDGFPSGVLGQNVVVMAIAGVGPVRLGPARA